MSDIETAFQDGCDTIVAGCTTYGSTPTTNSPSAIVTSIKNIYTNRYNAGVTATKKGTAVESNVLTGKTFTNSSSVGLTGSMTNNGAVTKALNCGGSYTIPEGYHNGSGKVTANTLASQTSATATAGRILDGYTAWVDGKKITGTATLAAYKTQTGSKAICDSLDAQASIKVWMSFTTAFATVPSVTISSVTSSVSQCANSLTFTISGTATNGFYITVKNNQPGGYYNAGTVTISWKATGYY